MVIEPGKALYEVLQPEYLQELTEADWKRISRGFYNKWNFPNCYASIDWKHIALTCPANSGSY